jgi:hypothetical protein
VQKKEEELLDISNSQRKREKALVAELEQLKAAAACTGLEYMESFVYFE